MTKQKNSKHEMLGDLLKFLIANECYVTVTKISEQVMQALVFENSNQQIEAIPRWTIISNKSKDYLIVDGDITPSGLPIVVTNIKEVISMYKKWISDDRRVKVYSLTSWAMGINPYITREADPSEGELAPLPEIEEEK